MRNHHVANERIKRRYFTYLEDAHQMAVSTVDQAAAAIAQFEKSTGYRDFKQFHIEQARKFKRQLQDHLNPETGKSLAISTIHSRLMALKAFFRWLAGQPGYKSRITYSDADYFNTSANDERVAKAVRTCRTPTLEQIRRALFQMPTKTVIERRDRAVIAFALVSGARDNAMASLSLRHIDLAHRMVDQDARDVRTKTRKSFISLFFPVGNDIEAVVFDWIQELSAEHLFGPDDPLFPSTAVGLNADGHFSAMGLTRRHWSNSTAIRKIFKSAFENAGLPYFNPHSFRRTLATMGERTCRTPEEFKAWSQNLGHEHVLTTFTSYGSVARDRQAEIMDKLTKRSDPHIKSAALDDALLTTILDKLRA